VVALKLRLDDDWIAADDGVTGPSYVIAMSGARRSTITIVVAMLLQLQSHGSPSSSLRAIVGCIMEPYIPVVA